MPLGQSIGTLRNASDIHWEAATLVIYIYDSSGATVLVARSQNMRHDITDEAGRSASPHPGLRTKPQPRQNLAETGKLGRNVIAGI